MNKIKVGHIANTHGIKGQLKIYASGQEKFDRDIPYFIGDNFFQVNVTDSIVHKGAFIVKLEGYSNINDVLKFKDKDIYINEADLMDLDNDEFYVKDLIGMEVIDIDNNTIGFLHDVLEYQANDVYIVRSEDGDLSIPAVKEFILDIDLEKNTIKVKLIEGM